MQHVGEQSVCLQVYNEDTGKKRFESIPVGPHRFPVFERLAVVDIEVRAVVDYCY